MLNQYTKALKSILNVKGNIFLSGVGKSGHIARKIASTLTSTGSPAYFIHPTEASHGDLGLVKGKDVIILLSNSGKSIELLDLLYFASKVMTLLITSTKKVNCLEWLHTIFFYQN